MAPSPATAHRLAREPLPPRLRPVEAPAPPAASARPGAVLRACRPRQWLKNVVVALAPASAGALTSVGAVAETAGAFVAFCLLASATYLVNDVRDRHDDRGHPRKRFRPVASGELSPRRALRVAALLAATGICLSVAIRPVLGAVAVCYLALTLSYSFVWRDVVVADIVVVAAGFLVRAAAGGVAIDVRLSKSFLLVTSACALLMVAGKRYAEARERGDRLGTRRTLRRYSRRALRLTALAAAALGAVAYASWAFTRSAPGPWIELSVVPFALWVGRYTAALGTGAGEAPEELILGDRVLLLAGAVWTILFLTGLYGAR
jgi:decaprenyl-phosphate phosphoribosyltransferase